MTWCETRPTRVRQVVIAPSTSATSVLTPLIRGEPDMVGLLFGSRELLCLFDRISGTLVRYSSLSELCLPGESASCQIPGASVGWWSNILFFTRKTGCFSGGLGTSRRRRVNQVSRRRVLPSPIQSVVPHLSKRFFSLTDSPYTSRTHFDTSPPGDFGWNGSHGESA
jgi:hypothetical protein